MNVQDLGILKGLGLESIAEDQGLEVIDEGLGQFHVEATTHMTGIAEDILDLQVDTGTVINHLLIVEKEVIAGGGREVIVEIETIDLMTIQEDQLENRMSEL